MNGIFFCDILKAKGVDSMSNATIYDVAGAAKVSLATVSRVLNNPEKVKPETRERVLRVINELGYRPNAIARGLASRKTTTVGVIASDLSRASVAQMLSGISDIAKNYKYSMKLFTISDANDVDDVMRNVIAEQVDGVLYLNDELEASSVETVINMLESCSIPMVLTNVVLPNKNIPSVSIDYEEAGYEACKRLIDEGRKNIYLLSTIRKYTVNDCKEAGYEKAMKEAGLESHIFRTSGDTTINRKQFESYFVGNDVDGVIAVRDSIAVSFMNVMLNKGVKVPEDISIVGFQNTKYALLSRPNLTCIDIPVYDIGAVSMRLLTKLMNGEDNTETNVVLPHRIIIRGTTK